MYWSPVYTTFFYVKIADRFVSVEIKHLFIYLFIYYYYYYYYYSEAIQMR